MNLIDAIKSGKRFRRSSWHALRDWVRPISNMCLSIPVDDILADDWEIEQTSVTITREVKKELVAILDKFTGELTHFWLVIK